MSAKPLIAITRPNIGAKKDSNYPHFKFILPLLGARVIRVSPDQQIDLSACDALILGGGSDIHPSHYGQAEHPNFRHDLERDAMEMALFEHFKSQGKPIMGICRGMQMINICLGGSMYQEIAEHFEDTTYPRKPIQRYFYRKPINIEPDTLLSSLFNKEQIRINSIHHQAIDVLGNDLKVSAVEPKGIIQGIEHTIIKNIFGVQWHPEIMHFSPDQWRLFKHFISLC